MNNWKTISEYPQYEVNKKGDVRNKITNHTLKPVMSNGYHRVTLCDKNGHHLKTVHRLVATEFVDNPNNYNQVNHIDGNKINNHVENLEWCTGSENMKHAYKTGLQKVIPEQIKDSLSKAVETRKKPVRNIQTGKRYNSVIDCANAENLKRSTVSMHLTGKIKNCRYEYVDQGGI